MKRTLADIRRQKQKLVQQQIKFHVWCQNRGYTPIMVCNETNLVACGTKNTKYGAQYLVCK